MRLKYPLKLMRGVRALLCTLVFVLNGSSVCAYGILGANPETYTPVYSVSGGTPLVMLTMARDHSLFFPAYNDLSDLDGDGVIDFRFKPQFEYQGLYDSYSCYSYDATNNLFSPSANAVTTSVTVNNVAVTVPGPCTGTISTAAASAGASSSTTWSGNFLNYVTTSRIDALRVALYGGTRDTDTATTAQSAATTILRRAYIPQDGHAWAKEYTSYAVDGYNINQYTPLSQPTSGTRHFFGNLTSTLTTKAATGYNYTSSYPDPGKSCVTLSTCSDYAPLLRVITNSDKRVWDWASSQRPVLNYVAYPKLWDSIAVTSYGAGSVNGDYSVRVKVCVYNATGASYLRGCQGYVNGALTSYKPTGILHDYGGAGLMNFGLITGSYDTNMSGGRLRKNIGAFTDEYSTTTGVFSYPATSIIKQMDNLRIRNFNNQAVQISYFDNFVYKNGNGQRGQLMTERYYGDWGNPIAEMMYESLRYFSGKTSAITAFSDGTSTDDAQVGLVTPTWTDPYPIGTGLSTPSNWCAKPSMMVVSGNPSFDADQLPGNYFTTVSTDLKDSTNIGIDTATLLNNISSSEGLTSGNYFVGQSGNTNDGAPTAKAVASLAQVRGLVPDETNSQGSYYAAAVAYFGKKSTLRDYGNGKKIDNVDTYVISLNDPLPKIVLPNGITIIPFARTILDNTAGNTSTISKSKGIFQPTNQIVGWYIESMNFSNPNNYSLTFRVNFEDSSWGNDFEMDVMARYEITGDSTSATIKVTPIANVVGGAAQNMGYVISGVRNANGDSQDGTYLVAQSASFAFPNDSAKNSAYFLNVPDVRSVGYCNADITLAECATLPYPGGTGTRAFSTRTFTASGSAAGYLKEPLWYAAKWGGYADGQEPTGPTIIDPDTYAKVSSPAKLKDTFINMLDRLRERSSASGAVSVSSQQLNTDSQVLSTAFNVKDFTGQVNSISLAVTQASPSDTVTYSGQWTASAPAYGSKKIYYKNKTTNSTSLREFTATNAMADYTANFPSADLVNYLRGNAEREVQNNGTFRTRNRWLGTTVNSTPAYSADTGMVYVGANDGMLHGLDAATGVEKFAYIPTSAIQYLDSFSRPAYTHRYLVDGDIAVSDKFKSGGVNYLVGFLGRAGKGLFGLQVYKPANANQSGLKTDGGAWENFGVGDADMGYLLGQPVIEELADGTDVVIFGNGYNSTNDRAALYVARLDNGIILAKFTTDLASNASSNGLATPGIVRSAGKAQYAYAGDYLGQVWKFDLSAVTGSSTAATTRSGTKVFTTLNANSETQPITAPITTSFSYDSADPDVANKRFIFFGTGSDLSGTDARSTQVQSIYGLIDRGASYPISNARGALTGLQQRTIDATSNYSYYRGNYTVQTRSFSVPVAGDMAGKAGWYMDWRANGTSTSEKVFGAAAVRSAVTPTLIVSSNIMNTSACATTGVGYLNAMDAYHGGGLTESYFDINRNGSYSDEVLGNGNAIGSIDFSTGSIGQAGFLGSNAVVQGGGTDLTNANNGNTADVGTKSSTTSSRRVSWREIVK